MKNEISNQIPCLKEEMWKRVCEVWYSVASNALENFTNQCQGEFADLFKQREVQRILIL